MELFLNLIGLPLVIAVCIAAHKLDRKWWQWLLVCIGCSLVLAIAHSSAGGFGALLAAGMLAYVERDKIRAWVGS